MTIDMTGNILSIPMLIGLAAMVALCALLLLIWIYLRFNRMSRHLDESIAKIVEFADADPLTGLPTRAIFFEHFKNKVALAKSDQQKIALLFMDLVNFRGIKDTLGYDVGDALLKAISKRLLAIVENKKDCLSRLGSDQFTIIIENAAEKTLYDKVESILKSIAEPYMVLGSEVSTAAVIGVSLYPQDGEDVETLIKNAAIARHHAKQTGTSMFSFYTKEFDSKIAEQRLLETHLRKAIEKKELIVCYQPKVSAKTRRIMGAEALLQWNNPQLGKISPAQFIPLAEQTGLIVSIGHWVLNEACRQAKLWHDNGFPDFTVAINLSAYQFKTGDIAEQVARVVWESEINPTLLELEITESIIMEDVEKSLLMLRVLKTMGIQVSVDDFGTGYSSLSQIRKFPVDSLKIDQSFVKRIQTNNANTDDSAIVTTIISMAKQLGLKTIAEGVETEQQFDFLKEQGCDLIQGFLFSPPIPSADFEKLLTKNRSENPAATGK